MSTIYRKGRRSTNERVNAAVEMMQKGADMQALSEKYGVHATTLQMWHDTALRGMHLAFNGLLAKDAPSAGLVHALEKENKQLWARIESYEEVVAAGELACLQMAKMFEKMNSKHKE